MSDAPNVFEDPVRGPIAAWVVVAALSYLAILLRTSLDIDGALDTDAINFGLAAFDFDVLGHRPHPPGYPGYVLFLKLIHGIAPGLEPLEVAKWGSRLMGALTVPAAYWACREALGGAKVASFGRPLFAASFAVVHPLLWFYGADGQSHGAEALMAITLLGLTLRVARTQSLALRLLVVVAFGLSGSIRPTIPLLSSPFLLWLFWGRATRDWVFATAVGVLSVLAWQIPLILAAGGWDLYSRANSALLGELFVANYSLFGSRATGAVILANINIAIYGALVAGIPLFALARAKAGWVRAWWSVLALNLGFYALFYTAELGYFTAVAGLSCMVPALWPEDWGRGLAVRAGIVALAGPLMLFAAPGTLPVVNHAGIFLPSYEHVAGVERVQLAYREIVCGAAAGTPALAITDNPTTTHTRVLTLYCPNVLVGIYLHDIPLNPKLDNWIVFSDRELMSLPTPIPLETGPPARGELFRPVSTIIIAPDASDALEAALMAQSSCEAARFIPETYGEEFAVSLIPAGCLSSIELGANTLVVPVLRSP